MLTTVAVAAPAPMGFPPGAEARQGRLLAKLGPGARGWIKDEARHEAAEGSASPATALGAAQLYANAQGGDAGALGFLVLMAVAENADQDLKDIQTGIVASRKPVPRGPLSQAAPNISPSEKLQMSQMMLQVAMERRDRMMQVVSDIMKKSADTGDAVVKNMK